MGKPEKYMTAEQIAHKRATDRAFYGRKKSDPDFRKRRKESAEKWKMNNRNNYLIGRKQQNKKNRLERIEYRLKTRYDLTIKQYNELFNLQNGCCAICGIHQNDLRMKLCVDHNHETGKIRGLLCKKCNLIIGNAKDEIIILKNAIKYLKNDK